jgi:SAM-dependent methyltransferase
VERTGAPAGSAELQGELWGARADAWAEQESQHGPIYEELIRRVQIGPGMRVLDLGCGSGVFLRAASDRGADVFGLDASEALIRIARRRVPEAQLCVGDLQFLPFDAGSFDVVSGFNSFQFAADIDAAMGEAARVARAGAHVVIQVWGRPEHCDLTAAVRALAPLRPPPPPNALAPPALWKAGALEAIACRAGLTPSTTGDISTAFEYEDDEAMLRSIRATAVGVQAGLSSGEAAVRAAILEAVSPFRTATGGYRLQNEWHYLVATA